MLQEINGPVTGSQNPARGFYTSRIYYRSRSELTVTGSIPTQPETSGGNKTLNHHIYR
ncbi:Hypothetical predicted protein [Scomber scombrus]|uniref:Uncharacterized protein n=1 Tax=Scomber scombrus TaxID=13677 RepID=A0AAV1QHT3_SCOSC